MSFELAVALLDFLDTRVFGLGRIVINRPYVTLGMIVLIYAFYRFFLWMGFGIKVGKNLLLPSISFCGRGRPLVFKFLPRFSFVLTITIPFGCCYAFGSVRLASHRLWHPR